MPVVANWHKLVHSRHNVHHSFSPFVANSFTASKTRKNQRETYRMTGLVFTYRYAMMSCSDDSTPTTGLAVLSTEVNLARFLQSSIT